MKKNYKPGEDHDEIPEWLKEMKDRRSGMKVPEAYFEGFADELMEKIRKSEQDSTDHPKVAKTFHIRKMLAWTAAAAASLLLIISLWNKPSESGPEYSSVIEDIPVNDAMAYLIENSEVYSWQDMVEDGIPLNEEELDKLGMENISTDIIIDELDEEEILELL